MQKTYMQPKEAVERNWYWVDATDIPLGRLASHVASVLKGKQKKTYTPHNDNGDFVIVLNAHKIKLTGNKLEDKIYYDHSQHPGGLKERTAKVMKEKYPVEMVERAIKGMLPKNRLGRKMYTKLFVYASDEHPHQAQQPAEMKVN